MRCLEEARKTSDQKQKAFFSEMANEWQRLAQQTTDIQGGGGNQGIKFDARPRRLGASFLSHRFRGHEEISEGGPDIADVAAMAL